MAELFEAAKRGDVTALRNRVAAGDKVSLRNIQGQTALHEAAKNGHINVVVSLAELGADLHCSDVHQRTPLFLAAANGHTDVVRFLLQQPGVEINMRQGPYKRTPLQVAAFGGHIECVRTLLIAGADASVKASNDSTAVDSASTPELRTLIIVYSSLFKLLCELFSALRASATTNNYLRMLPSEIAQEVARFAQSKPWDVANGEANR